MTSSSKPTKPQDRLLFENPRPPRPRVQVVGLLFVDASDTVQTDWQLSEILSESSLYELNRKSKKLFVEKVRKHWPSAVLSVTLHSSGETIEVDGGGDYDLRKAICDGIGRVSKTKEVATLHLRLGEDGSAVEVRRYDEAKILPDKKGNAKFLVGLLRGRLEQEIDLQERMAAVVSAFESLPPEAQQIVGRKINELLGVENLEEEFFVEGTRSRSIIDRLKTLGMTQREIGEATGISEAVISAIMRNEDRTPGENVLLALIRILKQRERPPGNSTPVDSLSSRGSQVSSSVSLPRDPAAEATDIVRQLRAGKDGLTLQEIADFVGISPSGVLKIANGKTRDVLAGTLDGLRKLLEESRQG